MAIGKIYVYGKIIYEWGNVQCHVGLSEGIPLCVARGTLTHAHTCIISLEIYTYMYIDIYIYIYTYKGVHQHACIYSIHIPYSASHICIKIHVYRHTITLEQCGKYKCDSHVCI